MDQKVSKVAQNGRHHQTQVYYDDSPETDSSQATRSFIEQMTPKPLFIGGGCVSESHAADLSHCNQPSPTERQNAILSTQRVRCLETRNLDEADSSCMFIKLLSSEPCFVFSSGGGSAGPDGIKARLGKYIQVPGFDAQMSDEAGRRPG